ncbi:Bacterioferritin (cytochrome b1) [Clostridium sp. N3C]|uniref:ferritin-like domain-containing protein n=1 Tax=Clostridium sp. N3C TaxID=1776758 RepID=UPI00092DF337|nr:ferritin-like domain-containing protein [Clostridium sp. N3C]SCN26095.1 Bacterioferritin (cytochrome b1) [Clostridium sp. N3C]
MNTTKAPIEELNAYLKGEYMAIDSYKKYINKATDPAVKADLECILQDHTRHAQLIADRIRQLGGEPAQSVDLMGKMGQLMNSIKNITEKSDVEICQEACYWEEQGSKMGMEVVKGDLDPTSCALIKDIYAKDMEHIDKLKKHIEYKNL